MDYRNYNGVYYIRADRGDEIISCIHRVCEAEGIKSAVFSGIGGVSKNARGIQKRWTDFTTEE